MTLPALSSYEARWFLEGFDAAHGGAFRSAVRPLPFRIGRRGGLGLTLPVPAVSQEHAEIYGDGVGLWLRDLDSTNGTFLNRRRLESPALLQHGDILHFADQEFRLLLENPPIEPEELGGTIQMPALNLPQRMGFGAREIRELIETRAFTPLYQPIVELASGRAIAHEVLCRGNHPQLPSSPGELFALASAAKLENELSRSFRIAVASSLQLRHGPGLFFFNIHPSELLEPAGLLTSVREMAQVMAPESIVIEIHEAAVPDLARLREVAEGLGTLGCALAYDDFGAGEARLLELAEIPSQYVKFDLRLVRDLDKASVRRRTMVQALVEMAHEMGIRTLAEGLEREEEAQAAREVGFELGQGYHFGRPESAPLTATAGNG